MKDYKLIFKYSSRLLRREWRRFVLPFLSLAITTVVMMLILLLTSSGNTLLNDQARELLGGDIVIDSSVPLDTSNLWKQINSVPTAESRQISFTATILNKEKTSPASILVIDDVYPLYGNVILKDGVFNSVSSSEIFLDKTGADKLGVEVGETVSFGEEDFTVGGIVVTEPTSLISGFRFFPQAFISHDGFERTDLEKDLLRTEYKYAFKFNALSENSKQKLRNIGAEEGFRVSTAEGSRSGLQFGLSTVSEFLIIVVLITAVLAAVNVYVSILYLIVTLRKSFSIFLALGMRDLTLRVILATGLGYIVLLGSAFGLLASVLIFKFISSYVTNTYLISLPAPDILVNSAITLSLVFIIALSAFIPVVKRSLKVNSNQTLLGEDNSNNKSGSSVRNLIIISVSTLIPLIFFASLLLESVRDGVLSILIISIIYVGISIIFYFTLSYFYEHRNKFSFFTRSVIMQKKADGLFGIISFTSLFVALTALCTLALIQTSLEKYLTEDLSQTLPTTYLIDIQPSQESDILNNFSDLTLFPNVSARIMQIDDVNIQEQDTFANGQTSRHLKREFNLTYRTELLESETVVSGVSKVGEPGEISVDKEFADSADIKLGSNITFLIQGFEVTGTVTSLRATESRSGLPFFYFVLSPEDIKQYPSTYFGYANYNVDEQKELSRYLATNMPNISVIETQALAEIILKVISTLLILILIITAPPLIIATLLVVTLVISSYSSRRRTSAKLRAIGATKTYVMWQYLVETISLTFIAAMVAYIFSVVISYGISVYYLELNSPVFFDTELIFGLVLVITLVGLIGVYLFKSDTMPLRELLSYEGNI